MQEFVQQALQKPGSHGVDHTLRVTSLCELIGIEEEANMDILIPAALFHDIARPLEKETGIPHEEEGARIAEQYLKSVSYPDEYIQPVMHAIRTHRFTSDLTPETLEAKILSDADKLDAMGAVGIARTFISAGERDGDITDAIDHIHEKLVKLKEMMYTTSARNIAHIRHGFLISFIQTIDAEMNHPFNPDRQKDEKKEIRF